MRVLLSTSLTPVINLLQTLQRAHPRLLALPSLPTASPIHRPASRMR